MSLVVLNGPTIAAGESLSDGIECTGPIVRLTMPPEWTRAPLTFQFSTDGTFYNDLFHVRQQSDGSFSGFEVTLAEVEEGVGLVMPPEFGVGIVWFKVRSGTRTLPVVQEEARAFAVVVEFVIEFRDV